MADTKISALPAATAIDGTETVPVLQGGTNKKAAASLFGWPPSIPWEDAGGETPSLVAIDPYGLFDGETSPDLGTTGKVIDSGFQMLGSRCKATGFIKLGTGATAGVGWLALEGLPIPPLAPGTAGASRKVGTGWFLNAADSLGKHPVDLLIEPLLDATRPVLNLTRVVDPDAAPTLIRPTFSNPFVDTSGLVAAGVPFDLNAGSILNVTLDFEGDFS